MKKFIFLITMPVYSIIILAQPTAITWQGKLLDAGGNAISDPALEMTFAMYDAETGGIKLWPAADAVTKTVGVNQGLYSVQLGTGAGDDEAFTAAMFEGKSPWLEVSIDGSALPRTPVTGVPFALISNELSAEGWETPGEIGKTTPNVAKFTSLETGTIMITEGASEGKVLSADAAGAGTWKALTPSDIGAATATHTHYPATTTTAGFMSPADKSKLNGLQNEMPADAAAGDMAYYDGTSWVKIFAPDESHMVLTFCDGEPIWTKNGECLEFGDLAHGGIVFYLFQPGDPGYVKGRVHGLVAAPDDLPNAQWGCNTTPIWGTETGIGTGAQNTSQIVIGCSETGAARICNDLELNGYDDWFLPSRDELYLMYQNLHLAGIGGFVVNVYWSSSQYSYESAWVVYFGNGSQGTAAKFNSGYVRAVRAF